MTSLLKHTRSAALQVCLVAGLVAAAGSRSVVLAQDKDFRTNTPVLVTRVFTGPDGLTHSEQITVKMARNARGNTDTSPSTPIRSVQLRRTAPNYFRDFHTPAGRMYVVTLFGRQNIGLSDGTTVRTYPGHVLLLEDTSGKGHSEKGVGIEDHVAALMELPPQ